MVFTKLAFSASFESLCHWFTATIFFVTSDDFRRRLLTPDSVLSLNVYEQ